MGRYALQFPITPEIGQLLDYRVKEKLLNL